MSSARPVNIEYWVNERPPFWICLGQGMQHVCIYAISLVFPVLVVRAAGGSIHDASFLVSMSLLAGGIGAILQSLRLGPLGAGYLCPQVCGPSFLTASILAAKTGGISLLLGMTLLAGMFEAIFSRIVSRLRVFFPTEVTGIIVVLVGVSVIRFAALNFLGMGDFGGDSPDMSSLAVAAATLGIMVGLNVWSRGRLRLFCVLVGMIAGYVLSWALGLFSPQQIEAVALSDFLWLPFLHHPGWNFSGFLIVPFLLAMICSGLKSIGDLTTCQKINDSNWQRPDMENISRGILADAAGCASAGVLGGMGQSTSSSNIGLSIATGITSRFVGVAMGAILIAVAFCPKLSSFFAVMPEPVVGATLVFALSFMVVAGFQIVMSRMLDARKTFVVGISLIFGLSVDLIPEAFATVHPWLRPVFSSSLSAGALTAILLNLVLRIGISSRVTRLLEAVPASMDAAEEQILKSGRSWGARKQIVDRASWAARQLLEIVIEHGLASGDIRMDIRFDELSLDIYFTYDGRCPEADAGAPDMEGLLGDPGQMMRLSLMLLRSHVDQMSMESKQDPAVIKLHYRH
ncbi:MAG: uracil-xanthine permease family protein [Desulfonatronovibrionaceae bacterium]